MKNRLWFLLPIVWLVQLFALLSRPKSEPWRTLLCAVGLVVLMFGLFLTTNISIRLLPAVPVVSVATALLGLFMSFIGFGLMMIPKKLN